MDTGGERALCPLGSQVLRSGYWLRAGSGHFTNIESGSPKGVSSTERERERQGPNDIV